MYKATNIDTDKALKAINDSRAIQERASQLRSEKRKILHGGTEQRT